MILVFKLKDKLSYKKNKMTGFPLNFGIHPVTSRLFLFLLLNVLPRTDRLWPPEALHPTPPPASLTGQCASGPLDPGVVLVDWTHSLGPTTCELTTTRRTNTISRQNAYPGPIVYHSDPQPFLSRVGEFFNVPRGPRIAQMLQMVV